MKLSDYLLREQRIATRLQNETISRQRVELAGANMKLAEAQAMNEQLGGERDAALAELASMSAEAMVRLDEQSLALCELAGIVAAAETAGTAEGGVV